MNLNNISYSIEECFLDYDESPPHIKVQNNELTCATKNKFFGNYNYPAKEKKKLEIGEMSTENSACSIQNQSDDKLMSKHNKKMEGLSTPDWIMTEIAKSPGNSSHRVYRDLIGQIDHQDYDDKWRKNNFKNLIFNAQVKRRIFLDHLKKTYKGLNFASEIRESLISQKLIKGDFRIKLPSEKKKILFIELENILVASCASKKKTDFKINYMDKSRESLKERVFSLRPHCRKFLKELKEFYDIYIFSSDITENIIQISNCIENSEKFFSGILSRKHCLSINKKIFIKNLDMISNRKLSDMIIVDLTPVSFSLNIDNGIPLLPWFGDPLDEELIGLKDYLLMIHEEDDFMDANRKWFKLDELSNKTLFEVIEDDT